MVFPGDGGFENHDFPAGVDLFAGVEGGEDKVPRGEPGAAVVVEFISEHLPDQLARLEEPDVVLGVCAWLVPCGVQAADDGC